MWTPDPSIIITAEQKAAAAAAAERLAAFPHLEPDQFWFVVRATGHEQQLREWVNGLNDPESERFNPLEWAAVSSKVDFGKHFERDHPFVEAAIVALGFDPVEFDALWAYGANA